MKIDAQTMLPATPQRTADARCTEPTPTIARAMVCVVETGRRSSQSAERNLDLQTEEFPSAAKLRQAFQQHRKIGVAVDRIEVLGAEREHRRAVVAVEEIDVGRAQPLLFAGEGRCVLRALRDSK